MTEPDKPGFMARVRARYPWFDHVMRAQERYQDTKGDFFAAGLTYFTIFALFPLAMLAFAVVGFLLASRPELLAGMERSIKSSVSGSLGSQLVHLMDSAIASRTSVGVIGLGTAAWAGLSWMANLREALSAMWGDHRGVADGFVRTKVSDLSALFSLLLVSAVTVGMSVLGNQTVMTKVLGWIGIHDVPGLGLCLRLASQLVSLGISWLLFTWIIARLPREPVSFRSALRAGLLVAVALEIFKQVASIYLKSVVTGPAGAAFGPVLGVMVFAYISSRLVLFATAWAATSSENMLAAPVGPPGPAQITARVQVREGLGFGGALTAVAVGAVGALGLSWRPRKLSLRPRRR